MKKKQLFPLLIFLIFQCAFSQEKEIVGDTLYWYKRNIKLHKTLKLKDFKTTTDDFNFRFKNHGQIVEVIKDSSGVNGSIVNYIFRSKRRNYRKDTLSVKIPLTLSQSYDVYSLVKNSGILNLPSQKDISEWSQGLDGIIYTVEYSNKKKYSFKTYWSPLSQNSIPEAVVFSDFVSKITDTLSLVEKYRNFISTLPKKGSYNSGGVTSFIRISNPFHVGYSGGSKLPMGGYMSYYINYHRNKKIDLGSVLEYNFDNNGFYQLKLMLYKHGLFHKKNNTLGYGFSTRKLNFNEETSEEFYNHQLFYKVPIIKGITTFFGVDYLVATTNKIGLWGFMNKNFSKSDINAELTTSILTNQLNYNVEIKKRFILDSDYFFKTINIGLAFEEYMGYRDMYLKVFFLL